MAVSVQLPGYNRTSPLENLAQTINAGASAYSHYKQSQLTDTEDQNKQAQLPVFQAQAAQATREDQAQQAAAQANADPSSPISKAKVAGASALYDSFKKSGLIKDENYTPIHQALFGSNESDAGPVAPKQASGQTVDQLLASPATQALSKQLSDRGGLEKAVEVANIKAEAALNAAGMRNSGGNPRIAQADERIHNQNLRAINTDPTTTQLITTANNLSNSIANYQQGGATPQEFSELQQAVRSNLGIKGASGISERGETYLNSLGIGKDKIVQFLTGNPQSVLKSDPKFSDQIIKIATLELQNKASQASAAIDQLSTGHNAFYNKPGHEDLRDDYMATVKAAKGRIGTQQQATQGSGQVGPHGPAVIQNGQQFNWNPQSGKYE